MFSENSLVLGAGILFMLSFNLLESCEALAGKNNTKKVRISNSFSFPPNTFKNFNRKKHAYQKKQLTKGPDTNTKTVVKFEVGKKPDSPDEDICASSGWNVENFLKIDISTINNDQAGKSFDPDTKCTLTFQGSKNCTPVFGCNGPISLRNRNSGTKICDMDFLKIEDGLGGSDIFCGNEHVPILKAAEGGRDLFVTFQSGTVQPDTKLHKGFSCYVHCDNSGKDAIAPSLKKTPRALCSSDDGNSFKTTNKNCDCGSTDSLIRNKTRIKTGRIIGGYHVQMNEFPFLVPIVKKGTRNLRCGGSIINSQFILSAAHCFVVDNEDTGESFDVLVHARVLPLYFEYGDVPPKEIIQKVPGYDLDDVTDEDEATIRYSVVEKIFHPLYTSEELDGDIVLLKLDRKIDFFQADSAKPICLPEHSRVDDVKDMANDDTYTDTKVSIAGWGKPFDNYSVYSRLPQKLEYMPMLNYSVCLKYLSSAGKITERMICSGFLEGGKDSCQGDSGSPLFFKESGGYYRQIGINSWGDGNGCAMKLSPGVYTDLRPLMQWIYFHTSQTEGVEWCNDQLDSPENHAKKNKTDSTQSASIENARSNRSVESKKLENKLKRFKYMYKRRG